MFQTQSCVAAKKGFSNNGVSPFSRFHPILSSSHWVGWCSSRMWIIPRPLKTCWIRWHHPNFCVPIRSQNLRMAWRTSEPPELRTTLPTRLSTCSRPAISDPRSHPISSSLKRLRWWITFTPYPPNLIAWVLATVKTLFGRPEGGAHWMSGKCPEHCNRGHPKSDT